MEGGKRHMEIIYKYLIIITVLFVTGSFVAILIYRSAYNLNQRNNKNAEQIFMLKSHFDYLQNLCDDIEKIACEIESTIHHHSNSTTYAPELLNKESECLKACDNLISTIGNGDTVLNALLYNKKKTCEEKNISFRSEIRNLPTGKLREMDLISLIANLLDNAIEAASSVQQSCCTAVSDSAKAYHENQNHSFVLIQSLIQSETWMLKISNSKDPTMHPLQNNMKTTKKDPDNHGMGTAIIRNIANRYNGILEMKDKGNIFIAIIVFEL